MGLETLYAATKQLSALFITGFHADGQEQDDACNRVSQEALLRNLTIIS